MSKITDALRYWLGMKSRDDWQFPRILMYHMVAPHQKGARFNKLRVTPEAFEAQIRWLSENGWHFACLSEVLQNKNLSPKTVVVTFDDGFEDNYLNAFPILKRYSAKATLFLVVDRHNRDWSKSKKAHHNSGELMHEAKLSDDQVKEMLESGVFELGGHTLTHAYLPGISDLDERKKEILECKEVLESQFNTSVLTFAYPFGIYEPCDAEILRNSGFLGAVTTYHAISKFPYTNPYEISRIKVGGKKSLSYFKRSLYL